MNPLNGLGAVEEEIIRCMKCGNCQAVCPIYQELKLESSVARGKIRLAEALFKGEILATPALSERFDLCLTCLACESICPSGVKVSDIILATRRELARRKGLPWIKRALFSTLQHPRILRRGAKIAARLQDLVFRRLDSDKMQPRFPLGLERRRIFPALAPQSLLEQVEEKYSVPKPLARVALFAGCLTNYVFPGVGLATLYLLRQHRVEVVVPRSQHCCGSPLIYGGAADVVKEMARSHVALFSGFKVDAILTLCGTCGEAFHHFYPRLLQDAPGYGEKAEELAQKTMDIARFLYQLPLDRNLLKPLELTATYHQPCHLGRGLGVVQEPIELIKSVPGVRYVPLQNPARCCGNAGSFSLTHYPLSYSILTHKLKDIAATGAEVVLTGCPACRMQLLDGLSQERMPQKVWHTVELLARACGFSK
ncbi:(Fe-S)-binding protein [Ammonifex thiophilus]|uniref:Glycolate oxidase iron-sulfur subunit n=1 Tax=Ammonifex thiophilus TaxID=444093 RepID=A0A3D8P2G4_9THEO|nr:(Fe-S)-binding protein [Ammonifex thiophilus]RDV82448.1 (Fe-S)-binding protein [Ammonifex thiophilus]